MIKTVRDGNLYNLIDVFVNKTNAKTIILFSGTKDEINNYKELKGV